MALYTDAKVNDYQVDHAISTQIITTDGTTKTSIGKIDNFFFEVNGIILVITGCSRPMLYSTRTFKNYNLIKMGNTHKYQQYKKRNLPGKPTKSPITNSNLERKKKGRKEKKSQQQPLPLLIHCTPPFIKPIIIDLSLYVLIVYTVVIMKNGKSQQSFIAIYTSLNALNDQKGKENKTTNLVSHVKPLYQMKKYGMRKNIHLESYPYDKHKIWRMISAKVESATPNKLLKIKNNSLFLPEPKYILTFDIFNDCDLIYNPLPHIIYTISEEKKPISSCALELESTFNSDSNSDTDNNKNNGSSSIQNGNQNNNDSNSNLNSEQYIILPDLIKKQKLKWFSNNNEGIIPECTHDTDVKLDLRYPKKKVIKLKPYLHICINLKIALEILATTMVQLASRNSLVKKRINIQRGIIDTRYVENIIAILQNDSEKTYIIEPNKKIAQAIFLLLVKIAQLVLIRNQEELGITARRISEFGFTDRIDVSVNMAEKKNQAQIFEVEPTICESEEIGFINLYILAKNYHYIKIFIYNITGDIVEIPEKTIIRYLTIEVENQLPNHIPDFSQLCEYVDITSQAIYRRNKCYLLQSEQLKQINLGNLDPLVVYHLEDQEDPESAFNNFFSELLQSTTLPQNYLFAPLITEINKEIEKYTKQRFLITFANKSKERLQTPAKTPKQIQLPT
ncbi:hypothetical protein G9A89_007641 [Geosiphon pyriformis]|nr:hypothetical protein G9A89_007641 [Geosiphon pyriformis]